MSTKFMFKICSETTVYHFESYAIISDMASMEAISVEVPPKGVTSVEGCLQRGASSVQVKLALQDAISTYTIHLLTPESTEPITL